jgi:hypothetical protein
VDQQLTRKLIERYGFLKFPTTYSDLHPEDGGITFAQGAREGVEVQEVRFFHDGIVIATGQSTEIAELVFSEVMDIWPEVGLTFSDEWITKKTYASGLAVQSEVDLTNVNPVLSALAGNTFGSGTGFRSIGLFTDGNFEADPPIRVERLLGVTLASKQFFSQAPLPTPHHLAFLESWEAALRS